MYTFIPEPYTGAPTVTIDPLLVVSMDAVRFSNNVICHMVYHEDVTIDGVTYLTFLVADVLASDCLVYTHNGSVMVTRRDGKVVKAPPSHREQPLEVAMRVVTDPLAFEWEPLRTSPITGRIDTPESLGWVIVGTIILGDHDEEIVDDGSNKPYWSKCSVRPLFF